MKNVQEFEMAKWIDWLLEDDKIDKKIYIFKLSAC